MMKVRTNAACPRDCPRRCAIPNCHNPETCEVWAEFLRKQAELKAAREKFHDAEDDFAAVKVGRSQKAAKRANRIRCKN